MDHLTFAQLLGNYGEFLGAIAVVATLAYLSVQIRQNTASVQSTAWQAWGSSIGEVLMPIAENRDLAEILVKGWANPMNLDQTSWMQFMATTQQLYYHIEAIHQMYQRNAIEQSLWEMELARGVAVLSLPGTNQWWEAGGKNQVSSDLRKLLETNRTKQISWSTIWWDEERGFHEVNDPKLLLQMYSH